MIRISLICLTIAAASSGVTTAADLVHLWDFEGEKWGDDKVGDAHGTITGATLLEQVDGRGGVGKAMRAPTDINGGDEYLELDNAELVSPGADAFSFSYWIRLPDDQGSSPRGIFDFSGNGRDGVQSLYIGTTDELAFRVDVAGAGFSLVKIGGLPLEDGEWHSVIATYDPVDGLEVHIDGFGVDGSAAAAGGTVTYDVDSYIGAFNFTGVGPQAKGLAGEIDDLAIFSGVLSEEEITALSQLPEPAPPVITSVSYLDGTASITWDAQEGETFAIFCSTDLKEWNEIDDSLVTGEDGGEFSFLAPEPVPGQMFLRLQSASG